jgi:glutaredoxin
MVRQEQCGTPFPSTRVVLETLRSKQHITMQTHRSFPMHSVILYTKAGCHLCDDARELLEDLAAEFPFDLREIDIRSDMRIFEEYRYRIPVLIIDGLTTVEGRISPESLRNAFQGKWTPESE